MGSGYDLFDPVSWPSDQTIGPSARANRMLLQDVMLANGFRPLKEEWWHFTLKDEPYPQTYFDFVRALGRRRIHGLRRIYPCFQRRRVRPLASHSTTRADRCWAA